MTPQRKAVLASVNRLRHATPEQVYEDALVEQPSLNLSTVYRTLEALNERGLISHAHIEERTPTYHAVSDHEHFHAVCHRCREVLSLPPESAAEIVDRLREEHGFAVDVGHLTVFGTCATCAQAATPTLEG